MVTRFAVDCSMKSRVLLCKMPPFTAVRAVISRLESRPNTLKWQLFRGVMIAFMPFFLSFLLHKLIAFCVTFWLAVGYGCTPQNAIFASGCVFASEYRRQERQCKSVCKQMRRMPFTMKNRRHCLTKSCLRLSGIVKYANEETGEYLFGFSFGCVI